MHSEVAARLAPIQKQAATVATVAKDLESNRADLESQLGLNQDRIGALQASLDRTAEEKRELEAGCNRLRDDVAEQEQRHRDMEERVAALRADVGAVGDSVAALDTAADDLATREDCRAYAKEAVQPVQTHLEAVAAAEIDRAAEDIAHKLKERCDAADARYAAAKAARRRQLADVEDRLAEMEGTIARERQGRMAAQRANDDLKMQVESMEERLDGLTKAHERRAAEAEAAQAEAANAARRAADMERDVARRAEEAAAQWAGASADIAAARQRLDRDAAALAEERRQFEDAQQRAADRQNALDAATATQRAELDKAKFALRDKEAEVRRQQAELRRKLADAEAASADARREGERAAVATAAAADRKRAADDEFAAAAALRDEAAALSAEAVAARREAERKTGQLEAQAEALAAEQERIAAQVAEAAKAAREAEQLRLAYNQRATALARQQQMLDDSIAEARACKPATAELSPEDRVWLDKRLPAMQAAVEDLEARVEDATAQLRAKDRALRTAQTANAELRGQVNEDARTIAALRERAQAAEGQGAALERGLADARHEGARIATELASAQAQLAEAQELANKGRPVDHETIAGLRARVEELTADRDSHQRDATAALQDLMAERGETRRLQARVRQLEEELDGRGESAGAPDAAAPLARKRDDVSAGAGAGAGSGADASTEALPQDVADSVRELRRKLRDALREQHAAMQQQEAANEDHAAAMAALQRQLDDADEARQLAQRALAAAEGGAAAARTDAEAARAAAAEARAASDRARDAADERLERAQAQAKEDIRAADTARREAEAREAEARSALGAAERAADDLRHKLERAEAARTEAVNDQVRTAAKAAAATEVAAAREAELGRAVEAARAAKAAAESDATTAQVGVLAG